MLKSSRVAENPSSISPRAVIATGVVIVAVAVFGPVVVPHLSVELGPLFLAGLLSPILSGAVVLASTISRLVRGADLTAGWSGAFVILAAALALRHWLRRNPRGVTTTVNSVAATVTVVVSVSLAALLSASGVDSGIETGEWWLVPVEFLVALVAALVIRSLLPRRQHRDLHTASLGVLLVGSSLILTTAVIWSDSDVQSLSSSVETATISFLNGANDDLTVLATKVSSTGAEQVTVDGFPTFIEVTVLGQASITSGSLVALPTSGAPFPVSTVSELGDLFDQALAEWLASHPDELRLAFDIGTLIDLGIVELPVPTGGTAPFYIVVAPLASDSPDPTVFVATMSVEYLLTSATLGTSEHIIVDFYSVDGQEAALLTSTDETAQTGSRRDLSDLGSNPTREASSGVAIGGLDYYLTARGGSEFGFGNTGRLAALLVASLLTLLIAALVLSLRSQSDRRDHERIRREAILSAALQGSPGWTAIIDGDNRVEMTNDGPFHVPQGELVESSTLWSEESETVSNLRSLLARARTGETSEMQVLWSDPHDVTLSMRIVEVSARPMPGVRLVLLQSIDVTEMRDRAMRTSQSERMEAIGVLAGGLAHDFNNLLFITLGYLQMLERQPLVAGDQQARTYVGRAVEAVERGAKVAKSLLSFARSQPLAASRVDLDDYIKDLTPLIEQAIGSAHQLRIEVEGQLGVVVDPGRLSSALLNVVFNARDAMETKGQLTLRIAKEMAAPLEQDPRPVVAISISDTGKGMPPEVAARAFEPFFTTKKVGSGTGLGLATLYSFAQQSGGWAAIDSTEGVGTTISLYLPPADDSAGDEVVEERDATLTTRALVLDDEPALADLVAAWLGDLGIATRTANTPEAALRVAREFKPQLVMSDANLNAELDGLEVARLLVEEHPSLIVVFMTGFSDRIKALQAAGVATLAKPFSREDLLATLSKTAGLRWERGPRG